MPPSAELPPRPRIGGRTFASLGVPSWRLLWSAGHLWNTALWLDLIALGWLALELTDSPLAVSLVGAARMAPMGLFGLLAGAQADRLPKQRILLAAQTLNVAAAVSFALLLVAGREQIWQLYAVSLAAGVAWAIDFPVRRAYIRELVPDALAVNAMSLDAGSLVGGSMVGRWLAGVLLLVGGATAAYLVLVAFYLCGWAMLRAVGRRAREDASAAWAAPSPGRGSAAPPAPATRLLDDVREGLRAAWASPAVRGVLVGSLIMNLLVFPYQQLLPVFVRDEWGQGPFVLGLLGGMDGLGALLATGAIATAARGSGRGVLFLAGSLLVTACVLAVAVAPSWLLAVPILLVAGLGRGAFASMQWTVTTSAVPGHLRGRAMGAISLAIGTVPLGAASLGVIAEQLGAPAAVLLMAGTGGLLVVALVFRSAGLRAA
ncbi:MAG: MFS transporter [Chloroflexi bacterium]|nr:MFS transporter [Chloroflexota bacterium]